MIWNVVNINLCNISLNRTIVRKVGLICELSKSIPLAGKNTSSTSLIKGTSQASNSSKQIDECELII